jgi:acetolactate synthase small subunit
MTTNAYLIRVQDHAGALERVLSTLRRKSLGMEKISLFPGPRGTYEVLISTSSSAPPAPRVKAELENLVDVREVQPLGEVGGLETRELALVRVPPGSGPFLVGSGRLLGQHADGDLLEITGAPEEVDAALADLAGRNVLTGLHRSGEVPIPPGLPYRKGENGK